MFEVEEERLQEILGSVGYPKETMCVLLVVEIELEAQEHQMRRM